MGRRQIPEKRAKDKQAAINVLNALIEKKQDTLVRDVFGSMPRRWQGKIKKQLTEVIDRRILEVLES
jgi:hypothetical protein